MKEEEFGKLDGLKEEAAEAAEKVAEDARTEEEIEKEKKVEIIVEKLGQAGFEYAAGDVEQHAARYLAKSAEELEVIPGGEIGDHIYSVLESSRRNPWSLPS